MIEQRTNACRYSGDWPRCWLEMKSRIQLQTQALNLFSSLAHFLLERRLKENEQT